MRLSTRNTGLEHRLAARIRPRLHGFGGDFIAFTLKQAWASLFGAALLAAIILSRLVWDADWPLARYDALVLYALGLQALFLLTGLESLSEARVILLFHLTGTAMEIFKVAAGSWAYPGDGVLQIAGVPLFSGFMYAAIGSYMVRVIRLFRMTFARYPPFAATVVLAVAIYVNFFSHHFLPDLRWPLVAATPLMFGPTRIHFSAGQRRYWMPLPLAALLTAAFVFLAENIGTITGTWLYAGQTVGQVVPWGKFSSWYLLLYVAFVTVTLVVRGPLRRGALYLPSNRAGRFSTKAAMPSRKSRV
ncbi:DUF817 domain-containing protein [Halodurantibacterium flavum]|uniref:DUF817 domain-containing protein n=1 Tax=Halodurantibacterium flavum TaxID=1382802 RepID=A0ABW4S673_9RHOB